MSERLTPDGLPIISGETASSTMAELLKRKEEGYLLRLVETVEKENPVLLSSIREVLQMRDNDGCSKEFSNGLSSGIVFAYEMLRRQANSNNLTKKLKT